MIMSDLAYSVGITPAHSGFGMWDVCPNHGDVQTSADFFNEIDSPFYELGKDDLPAEIEDIRGNIYDEPSRVFAVINPWGVEYFGVEEASEAEENG
jgi:hypothetical protein